MAVKAKKKTAKKKAKSAVARKRVATGAAARSGTVSIRMYRGLLGDFFLVTHKAKGQIFRMLIDCGVLQRIGPPEKKPSTERGKERIVANVADFMKETKGRVDLVVATHEHFDHLSGFILAAEAFENFKIGKVWMAWTEDPADEVANGYRSKKKKALAALAGLAMNPALAKQSDRMQVVDDLLQFYGEARIVRDSALGLEEPPAKKLPGNASCSMALDWLKKQAGAGNVSFLKPGAVVRWGVGNVFRAYVLGPPREDEKLLRKLNPSKTDSEVYLVHSEDGRALKLDASTESGGVFLVRSEKEKSLHGPGPSREGSAVYLVRGEDAETVLGLAAIHGDLGSKSSAKDQPFTQLHARPYPDGDGVTADSMAPDVKAARDKIIQLYKQSADRTIDNEWLGSAESLALKIDGDVNNTSLALAFELPGKKVLLFPGDAQVGNWLSWGSQTYPADDTKDGPVLKIEDILARTIFYKVGHHASHNATLRERGLELMTHPELVAMIPVVEKTAREQKTTASPNGWAMPYGKLYDRLEQRTDGRIVRGDGVTAEEISKFKKKSIFALSYGADFEPGDPYWAELTVRISG